MDKDLSVFAAEIRFLTARMLHAKGYGHFGGSLSIVEALAALYGRELRVDPHDPLWAGRDFFVLSKGHGGPALYATLAARGFFGIERLYTLNDNGTLLPSHPDRVKIPGVEMTTGSMGQGISAAAGIAYGLRAQGRANRVYTIVGDGELNEGQCWEAAQFIAHQRLTNLVVMVDANLRQLDGWTKDICETFDFVEKFAAFGFAAQRVDGQDAEAIADALQRARSASDRPVCLVLDTTKGAGVDYVAQASDNHHMRLDEAGLATIASRLQELEAELMKAGIIHE
ncbi:MAG: transketolase [Propioniciclava sp.]|uniref:transketolase n=1 Tax=Propioniciclava sp. TaxID=2038686 RepID=UPI0039E342AE